MSKHEETETASSKELGSQDERLEVAGALLKLGWLEGDEEGSVDTRDDPVEGEREEAQ